MRSRLAELGPASFGGRVLGVLFLVLAFSCTGYAQLDTGFALTQLNTSSISCYGSSNPTPDNVTGVRQAACLTPFPCMGTTRQQIAGQCIHNTSIKFSQSPSRNRSFSTMFSFNTLKYPTYLPGEGFTFFLAPANPGNVSTITGGNLGWLDQSAIASGNHSGHNFAVEFDLVRQTTGGFNDPEGEHVGFNVNNLNSTIWKTFEDEFLASISSVDMLYVWIDYDGDQQRIDMRLSKDNARPCKSLLAGNVDLTDVLVDTMYVGFSSSTGAETNNTPFNTQTTIFDWSFSTTGQAQNIYGRDERCGLVVTKTAILGIIIGVLSFLVLVMICLILFLNHFRARKVSDLEREKAELVAELQNLDFGARAFTYQELSEATKGFTHEIGKGGFGIVYKGTLSYAKGTDTTVAVKKIKKTTDSAEDAKQLVAEVKVIGRLRHVNIVPVLGWCYEKEQMLLVYKYMENGDLDQWIFPADYGIAGKGIFTWAKRMTILKGVASALKFLHEDFDSDETVLHRDIKTRNVMIDGSFNARLGDFGLARFCDRSSHGHHSQRFIGTRGYIAPEYEMGASEATDVYSFGVLALVVATGRKPFDRNMSAHRDLPRWVGELSNEGRITDAGDPQVMNYDATFNIQEMERVLKMGLFCCSYDSSHRPLMHDVVTALNGDSSMFSKSLPTLSQLDPAHVFDFPGAEYDDVTIPFDDEFYSSEHAML